MPPLKPKKKARSQSKEEIPVVTLSDVREGLWRSIPSVAQAIAAMVDAPMQGEDVEGREGLQQHQAPDVLASLSIPWAEMQHVVCCLYMAIHSNPIPTDVAQAVAAVVGTVEAPLQERYSREDLYAFMDTIPSRWLPDTSLHTDNVLQLNEELVQCVTTDEPLVTLVDDANKVLLPIRAIPKMVKLHTNFDVFVPLTVPSFYKETFFTLWRYARSAVNSLSIGGEEPTETTRDTLTAEEFGAFVAWFLALHFTNTFAERSALAARTLWLDHLNERGQMDMPSFERACSMLCACYAQQDDAEAYLAELLHAAQLQASGTGESESNPLLVIAPAHVPIERPLRRLEDPIPLYVPEEMRPWRQEHDFVHRGPSENRILLHGPRCLGKTTVGSVLAKKLNGIHLDVLELASKALANAPNGDSLGQQLQECVQQSMAISLSLQAALLHREVTGKSAYHGYVMSDALPYVSGHEATVAQFMEEAGLVSNVIPTVFLELCSEDAEWALEVRGTVTAARRVLYEGVMQRQAERQAQEQRRKEREDIRASATVSLARYAQIQSEAGVTDEQLEEARRLMTETQEILDGLSAEKEQEAMRARLSSTGPEGDTQQQGGHDGDSEDQDRDEMKLMLAHLIERGRSALYSAAEQAEDAIQPITALPTLRLAVERATARGAVVALDAASSIEAIVAYVTETLRLEPTLLATELTVDEVLSKDVATLLEDEHTARRKEKAALAGGCEYSATWKRYCPVSCVEDKVLIEGSACYGCELRSKLYLMASFEKLERFQKNPLFYLRRLPVDLEPILLVADEDALQAMEENAVPDLWSVVRCLAQDLQISTITLPEFASCHGRYRKLRDEREAVLKSRVAFNEEERRQRAERLQIRLKKEAKRQRYLKDMKSNPKKPTVRNARAPLPLPLPPPSSHDAATRPSQLPERLADALAQAIAKLQEDHKTHLPVLVTAFHQRDFDAGDFDLLLEEGVIPRRVVVLQCESPDGLGEGTGKQTKTLEGAEAAAAAPDSPSFVEEIMERLDRASESIKGEDAALRGFNVHIVNMLGTSQKELLCEVFQRVSPAAPQTIPGVVDEQMGEDSGEDEADEEDAEILGVNDDDEHEADEDASDRDLRELMRATRRVEQLLKPRRRFLHQFGSCLHYCPVTLREQHLLVRGRNDLCVSFLDGLYCCASEECLARFQQNPLKYACENPPEDIPPRCWLVGQTCSGRKTLAAGMHQEYGLPFFTYNQVFFEKCLDAAVTMGGDVVEGIFIPPADPAANAWLAEGLATLKELRSFAAEQERCLKLRHEAERELEELMTKEEEEQDEEAAAREEELQQHAAFEPEEEEDKQARLSEACLLLASCVTRIEPFNSNGYVMICSPFSSDDMDILFSKGCIPEVVIYLEVPAEIHHQRLLKAREEAQAVTVWPLTEDEINIAETARQQQQTAQELKARQAALSRWRRRHIGPHDDHDNTPPFQPGPNEAKSVEGVGRSLPGRKSVFVGDRDAEGSFSMEFEAIEQFVEEISQRLVDVVHAPGGPSPGVVLRVANELLQRHLRYRKSFFYIPQVLHYDASLKMLQSGRAVVSCFGRSDQVELFEKRGGVSHPCHWKPAGKCSGDVPQARDNANADKADDIEARNYKHSQPPLLLLQDPDEIEEEMSEYGSVDLEEMEAVVASKRRQWDRLTALRCAVLRNRVYYFKQNHSLRKFLLNPIPFLRQPPPAPTLPSQVAIAIFEEEYVAPTNDTKRRSFAESLAYNLDAVFISTAKLLSWAAAHPWLGSISAQAISVALGEQANPTFIERLLFRRLGCADVKLKGAVLLNWPRCASSMGRALSHPVAALITRALYFDQTMLATCGKAALTPAWVWYNAIHGELSRRLLFNPDLWAPNPASPVDSANLITLVQGVVALADRGRDAVLRRRFAFPIDVTYLWHTREAVAERLTSYQWYCPFSWVEQSDLVDTRPLDFLGVVEFLGQFYFFSSEEYLKRFLLDPHLVAEKSLRRLLPPHLPTVVADPFSPDKAGCALKLEGHCPVVLYDTREQRGLRGAIEPTAKLGSLSCVVLYDGAYYACLDPTNQERFLKRPWQYVEAKVPLPPPHRRPLPPASSKAEEEKIRQYMPADKYIKRYLYDDVVHAMLAVAAVRPHYPGLSIEESALKYVSLYLKAHHENATEFQKKQYAENLALFEKRSTLYTKVDPHHLKSAADGVEAEKKSLCVDYDALHRDSTPITDLSHLPRHFFA